MKSEFLKKLYTEHQSCKPVPSPTQICTWLDGILSFLFPQLSHQSFTSLREFEHAHERLHIDLIHILNILFQGNQLSAELTAGKFMDSIPDIYEHLKKDAESIHEGDPASTGITEVIRSYPGFLAIAAYRLAHQFVQLNTPLIPRIITEHAHSKTGIDIHPHAKIGHSFCIDHGTGIVIGETTEIGNHVKLYQGVTLGALSVKKDMAKIKRHPTIQDRVVIYASSTILGGKTIIGHDSTIGGNVWITESVPPNSKIYYKPEAEFQK
jgi:serine O-acetyltransferase